MLSAGDRSLEDLAPLSVDRYAEPCDLGGPKAQVPSWQNPKLAVSGGEIFSERQLPEIEPPAVPPRGTPSCFGVLGTCANC